MRPLFTEQEFESYKSNDLLPLNCCMCDSQFYARKKHIKYAREGRSRDAVKYCSRKCHSQAKGTKINCMCKSCNKQFRKKPSQCRSAHNFCSKSCAGIYNSANRTHGTRRSKLEVYLEKELNRIYPDCDIHFNKSNAIGAELDIYIPILKLAFELNGIFHYKPIFGDDKLASTQSNDLKKINSCTNYGIALHTVDVTSIKNFTSNSGLPYLNYVLDIIHLTNKNLSGPGDPRDLVTLVDRESLLEVLRPQGGVHGPVLGPRARVCSLGQQGQT